jgi:hypothetical protein
MKVFAVITVARQVEGEYIAIKPEKAFTKASQADEYSKNLAKKFAENVTTPVGIIQCLCERGVIEIDVEE